MALTITSAQKGYPRYRLLPKFCQISLPWSNIFLAKYTKLDFGDGLKLGIIVRNRTPSVAIANNWNEVAHRG